MSGTTDLYELLGVQRNAEPGIIRAAYRRLAWRCHPDVGGSQCAMASLNNAWRILRDPSSRAMYDSGRSIGKRTGAQAAAMQDSRGPIDTSPRASDVAGAPSGSAGRSETAGGGTTASGPPRRPITADQRDGSTVLDFGRYEGWSLSQLAAADPDYLEWLSRTSIGRRLQPQIAALLAARRASAAGAGAGRQPTRAPRRWGRRGVETR